MTIQSPPSAAKPVATYQDVLDAPEHMVAEILHGELALQPRPAFPHARAGSILGSEITGPFDRGRGGPGGWWILDEPELRLGDDVIVPDLAGWRRATTPALPDGAWCEIAPDWACEILSPLTYKYDLTDKRDIYARENVRWLWFVDPKARTLEAFENRDGAWTLLIALRDDAEVKAAPFDAVPFPLDALWL